MWRWCGAALAIAALVSCGHHVPAAAPAPPHTPMWTFPDDAQDGDPFCVPADSGGVACTTVGQVRWFVQHLRRAE